MSEWKDSKDSGSALLMKLHVNWALVTERSGTRMAER